MSAATWRKRGVQPLLAVAAQAEASATLAFRHAGAFATLLLQPTDSSTSNGCQNSLEYAAPHGVLLTLSREDFQTLAGFETGYTVRNVTVQPYSGGRMAASVFVSERLVMLQASLPPKEKYLALIRAGARERGLCTEYCAWLESLSTVSGSLGAQYFDTPAEKLARAAAAACAVALTLAVLQPL